MAAEALGFMARGANGGRAAELVTRDFLGGCAATDDARDASAAARNDAVPGTVSQQKHACPATPRDLNLFPVGAATKPCAVTTAPAPSAAAAGSSAGSGATTTYHSVCTIEKVKTALERFERGKQHLSSHPHQHQQHSGAGAGASPSSSSVTTSSVKRRGGDSSGVEQGDGCDSPSGGGGGGGMVAAACPRCFLYVLISRSDPRCPRCESHVPAPPVPAPAVSKKPRIDLNVGYLGT